MECTLVKYHANVVFEGTVGVVTAKDFNVACISFQFIQN